MVSELQDAGVSCQHLVVLFPQTATTDGPPPMIGSLLTTWTVRLALGLYVTVLAGNLLLGDDRRWTLLARWLWTLGCLCFSAHVAAAFHFYHAWSHSSAYAQTARETQDLLGLSFGAGIYFSYLFTLLWAGDTALWWLRNELRRGAWNTAIQLYLLFIAFNGAIIFEDGPIRWYGIAATTGLVAIAAARLLPASRRDLPEAGREH